MHAVVSVHVLMTHHSQDQVKPKGNRGDHSQYKQKEFLCVSVEDAHAGFMAELPEDRRVDAPLIGTFRKWRPYWVKLRDDRHTIGCVCVHHARCGISLWLSLSLFSNLNSNPNSLLLCVPLHCTLIVALTCTMSGMRCWRQL